MLYKCFFCFLNSISEIEPKYYADGEDAYAMKRDLTGLKLEVGFIYLFVEVVGYEFHATLLTKVFLLNMQGEVAYTKRTYSIAWKLLPPLI